MNFPDRKRQYGRPVKTPMRFSLGEVIFLVIVSLVVGFIMGL